MTKTAKLDAATVSLDRPAPVLRAAAARQPGAAPEAAAPPQIDNALVAELESALQAVATRAPRPQASDPAEAAAPGDERHGFAAGASEPVPPPNLLLRPAEAPEPRQAPSWELETAADERRPGAEEPRRRRLPLRAALCVGGLLGLVGAGGAGLIFAAAPDDEFAAPLPKPVKTETIRAAAAPAAMNAQPEAAERETASEDPIAAGAPAEPAPAAAPAGEVTLLRPVGASRSAAPVEPAERTAAMQDRPPEASGAAETVKTPDRLVAAPAPAGSVRRVEEAARQAPINHFGAAADGGGVSMTSPVAEPAGGAAERLPSEPSGAAGEAMVATVPTPLAEAELVARTGPAAEEEADASLSQQEMAVEAAESGEGARQPALAAGEPTRSAPVTGAVNMRAGPDNDAAVLTVVPAGSEVEVIGCEHWCEVVFGGERGWIYRSFIGGADS